MAPPPMPAVGASGAEIEDSAPPPILMALLSAFATISTLLYFLASIPTARRIRAAKSSANVEFVPFVAGLANGVLWIKYGLLQGDWVVTGVNTCGFLLNAYYLYTSYIYAPSSRPYITPVSLAAAVVYGSLGYIKFGVSSFATAVHFIGLTASLSSIVMFASPLSTMAKVLATKSTESMVFSLCFMGFIVSVSWSLYGYLLGDLFIQVPNAIGALLSTLQLLLFVKYPTTGGPGHVYDVAARLI